MRSLRGIVNTLTHTLKHTKATGPFKSVYVQMYGLFGLSLPQNLVYQRGGIHGGDDALSAAAVDLHDSAKGAGQNPDGGGGIQTLGGASAKGLDSAGDIVLNAAGTITVDAIGGGVVANYIPFNERYDAAADVWEPFEIPAARAGTWKNPAVASLPTEFYVIGGSTGPELRSEMFVYEVLTNKSFLPSLRGAP